MTKFVKIGDKYRNVAMLDHLDQQTMDRVNAKQIDNRAVVKHFKWLAKLSFEEGYKLAGGGDDWREKWANSQAKKEQG